jgi:hypothetical protein
MTNAQQYLATQSWPAKLAQSIYGGATLPGDVYAGRVDPGSDEAIRRSADLAGVVTGGSYAAPAMKDATGMGIRAYHSSPYDFERFDLSKLRTGEGANMQGAGAYLAENPAVSGQGGTYWGQFLRRFPEQEQNIAESLKAFGFDRDAVIKQLQDHNAVLQSTPSTAKLVGTGGAIDRTIANNQRDIELLRSGQIVGPRTYEVNFNARPDQLLNLDAPLYGQGPRVADAFKNITGMELGPPTGLTGAPDASQFIRSMGRMKSPEYVSAAFNEAGIRGSRYLDQGSRFAPDQVAATKGQLAALQAEAKRDIGTNPNPALKAYWDTKLDIAKAQNKNLLNPTYNYVSFAPHVDLDIMKKYAVPGAVGAGGIMGGIAAQDNYQPQ